MNDKEKTIYLLGIVFGLVLAQCIYSTVDYVFAWAEERERQRLDDEHRRELAALLRAEKAEKAASKSKPTADTSTNHKSTS